MPFLGGLLSGVISGGAGLLTDSLMGGSKGVTNAYARRNNALQGIIDRITKDAGTSATDSLFYKTASRAIEDRYKRQRDSQRSMSAAMGLTNEAQLGQLDASNQGQNLAENQAIGMADTQRQSLLARADGLTDTMNLGGIQQAEAYAKNVGGIGSALSGVVGNVLNMDSIKKLFNF
jgi:hypothetical protein